MTERDCICDPFDNDERNGHSASCNRWNRKLEKEASKPPKLKKAIKRAGKTMTQKLALYSQKKKEFMIGKICPIYPNLPVEDIHHKKGRDGDLLLDERYWLAVSRKGHIWIELHPIEAKEKGYSLSRLEVTPEQPTI